jgi:phosphate transport system permease protein
MAGTSELNADAAVVAPPRTIRATLPKTAEAGKRFWRQGEPLVWACGAALAGMLLLMATLLVVVAVNGLGVFWPASLVELTLGDGSKLLGRRITREVNPDTGIWSVQLKTANREFDRQRQDFRWVEEPTIRQMERPADVYVLERLENGDFYGFLRDVKTPGLDVPLEGDLPSRLRTALVTIAQRRDRELNPLTAELSALSDRLQGIRNAIMKIDYRQKHPAGEENPQNAKYAEARKALQERERSAQDESQQLVQRQHELETALAANVAVFAEAHGQSRTIPILSIVRAYRPNDMGLRAKTGHYLAKLWELFTAGPRESNTEGGLFPAIFGTLMLMFIMAVSGFPLGVVAGVYLGEYAHEGPLVRVVRIAVNNLAGIPSIVYGIFGLGFFVYGVGGLMDRWLYPERVAAGMPTFGTGGILWAALTLGLLTMPVVIVATEEALRAIPRAVRESSLALGATKFQTLVRVLLPMASPGIMTGFILAMARAAGEVAPLMITGVVKLAPSMPLDGQFPFFHLDRKFMHLGFHIYDIGFQSPNVEAAKPMVFVTTLLLVLLVLAMSSVAICLRNKMRKRLQLRSM